MIALFSASDRVW